jgi:hypothetical protein
MEKFIERHADRIIGTLSCFDRILFRGYLPIMSGAAMALYLKSQGVRRETVKAFVLEQAARLKAHALDGCTRTGRPYQYLGNLVRKEEMARKIAERDGIKQGLVCVLSVVEPCRTFSLAWNGRSPQIRDAKRKCLQLYYYFMDRDLGLIHVKVQTWFPFRIQVYVNGHEWLARQMAQQQMPYVKLDNAFLRLGDVEKTQRLADGFERVDWVHLLDRYAIQVNPLLEQGEILATMRYYWVTAQAEYSTDVLFRRRADLDELMPRLCQYATLYFGANDVMTFLGRKLTGHFLGEVVTDHFHVELHGKRIPGRRVKHRVKCNWIKMYDRGPVLRVETVINNPEEFRIRKRVRREGRDVMAWVPLRKSVTLLFRYREISAQSNARYLEALSQVQDPTLAVLLLGEHALHGLRKRDLRQKLARTSFSLAPPRRTSTSFSPAPRTSFSLAPEFDKRPGQVTQLLRRLHAHGLVAKIPNSRRWQVSLAGRRTMTTAIKLREVANPSLFATAA